MKIAGKEFRTIWYENNVVKIIDQTKLPHKFIIKALRTVKDAINAIKIMEVRGAPLIGGTAAYGMVLAVKENNDPDFIKKILRNVPQESNKFLNEVKELKIFPVFVSDNLFKIDNNKIHLIGDAFFAFPPSFAQGASQSIEGAFELFKSIENNTESNFFKSIIFNSFFGQ